MLLYTYGRGLRHLMNKLPDNMRERISYIEQCITHGEAKKLAHLFNSKPQLPPAKSFYDRAIKYDSLSCFKLITEHYNSNLMTLGARVFKSDCPSIFIWYCDNACVSLAEVQQLASVAVIYGQRESLEILISKIKFKIEPQFLFAIALHLNIEEVITYLMNKYDPLPDATERNISRFISYKAITLTALLDSLPQEEGELRCAVLSMLNP